MMELWMHGLGNEPEKGAALLKKLGFKAVVTGASQTEAVIANGMDAYICSGAYRGPSFKGEDWMAVDTKGNHQPWFSSTCPTREEVRNYNLDQIARMAKTPGIKGILIDGARFASPASNDDPDCFYTCFCPSCRQKMKDLGFDPVALETAVDKLYDLLHGKKLDLHPYIEPLMDWLSFRRIATTEHLKNFADTVRSVDPDLVTGIYIFAPSLSTLVGQSYRDCSLFMDLVAPMLYRAFDEAPGPSCLNMETYAIMRMLNGAVWLSDAEKTDLLKRITGLPFDGPQTLDSLKKGFSPDILRLETSRARTMLKRNCLAPIIQLDDPLLEDSVSKTMEGGADLVNFFVYDQKIIEKNAEFFERNKK